MTPDRLHETLSLVSSVALLAGYELWVWRRARQAPHAVARSLHAQLRERWVRALAAHPGSELLAVQTVRNSLMSSTIVASTAALALTGTLSLGLPHLADALGGSAPRLTARGALVVLLLATLFASFVASALAMRLFNHVGYLVSYPVGSAMRAHVDPMAAAYLRRAGHHYSWSLRLLFMVAPLLAGIVSPLLTPVGAAGLVVALALFDRSPRGSDDPPWA